MAQNIVSNNVVLFTSGKVCKEIYERVVENSVIQNKIKAHYVFCFKKKEEYKNFV